MSFENTLIFVMGFFVVLFGSIVIIDYLKRKKAAR